MEIKGAKTCFLTITDRLFYLPLVLGALLKQSRQMLLHRYSGWMQLCSCMVVIAPQAMARQPLVFKDSPSKKVTFHSPE